MIIMITTIIATMAALLRACLILDLQDNIKTVAVHRYLIVFVTILVTRRHFV
jgi:hypothetical protein